MIRLLIKKRRGVSTHEEASCQVGTIQFKFVASYEGKAISRDCHIPRQKE